MVEQGQTQGVRQVWFPRNRLRVLLFIMGVAGAVSAATGAAFWWLSAPASPAEERSPNHRLKSFSSPIIRSPAPVTSELPFLSRSVLQNEQIAGERAKMALSSPPLVLPIPVSTRDKVSAEKKNNKKATTSSPRAGKDEARSRPFPSFPDDTEAGPQRTTRKHERRSTTHAAARGKKVSQRVIEHSVNQSSPRARSTAASTPMSIKKYETRSSSHLRQTGYRQRIRPSTVGSRTSESSTVDQRLHQVRRLIRQRHFTRALAILKTIVEPSSSSWALWFWKGTALLGLEQLQEADAAFARALDIDDTIPALWVQRAVVSQQSGNHALALDYLRQAELLAPDRPEVLLNLAYSLEAEGFRPLAESYYRRFLLVTQGQTRYRAIHEKVIAHLTAWSRPSR